MDREAWRAVVHGIAESDVTEWLDWTESLKAERHTLEFTEYFERLLRESQNSATKKLESVWHNKKKWALETKA